MSYPLIRPRVRPSSPLIILSRLEVTGVTDAETRQQMSYYATAVGGFDSRLRVPLIISSVQTASSIHPRLQSRMLASAHRMLLRRFTSDYCKFTNDISI